MATNKGKKYKKTGTPCIYFNNWTQKYDAIYHYKIYNPITKENEYKQKPKNGFLTITEAKEWLSNARLGNIPKDDKDITLEGAFLLWQKDANSAELADNTKINGKKFYKMIIQFVDKETRIKDINNDIYDHLLIKAKEKYSTATIVSIKTYFRRFINLTYEEGLVVENPLNRIKKRKVKQKTTPIDEYFESDKEDDKRKRVIPFGHFYRLNEYFYEYEKNKFNDNVHLPNLQLMFNLLYYTGIRIGEALALRYCDFKQYKFKDKYKNRGYKLVINKALAHKKIKTTKTEKNREIPISANMDMIFRFALIRHKKNGGSEFDKVFNLGYASYDFHLKSACKKCGLPLYFCHNFRHTFITGLMIQNVPIADVEKYSGDTQVTIFKNYSHSSEGSGNNFLQALDNLKKISI